MTDPRVIAAIDRDFIPYAHCGSPGLNNYRVVTAAGKVLADHDRYPTEAMSAGLLAWSTLPEEERKARNAFGVPRVKDFPRPPEPPRNGLILRSTIRALQRDEDGDLTWTGALAAGNGIYSIPAEPQLDHMWITESEWKAMIPVDPQLGGKIAVPKAVAERLATFHLMDKGVGCNGFYWDNPTCDMSMKIVHVSPDQVKLELQGMARIGKKVDYPVRLQGKVEVDRARGEFTRFDMIALGKDNGDFRTPEEMTARNNFWYRLSPKCKVVMAFAFEKVNGDKPLERVPPYPIMYDSQKVANKPYFPPVR